MRLVVGARFAERTLVAVHLRGAGAPFERIDKPDHGCHARGCEPE